MRKLKNILSFPPTLKIIDYECGSSVILTIDTSFIEIGWAIGQDDVNGNRYVVRFDAKVLSLC
jgi:hypothetical protein